MVYTHNKYTDKQSAESNDMVVQMGNVQKADGEYCIIEKTFEKSVETEDITIFLPGVCYIEKIKHRLVNRHSMPFPSLLCFTVLP